MLRQGMNRAQEGVDHRLKMLRSKRRQTNQAHAVVLAQSWREVAAAVHSDLVPHAGQAFSGFFVK